jgi:hypothetical protein
VQKGMSGILLVSVYYMPGVRNVFFDLVASLIARCAPGRSPARSGGGVVVHLSAAQVLCRLTI